MWLTNHLVNGSSPVLVENSIICLENKLFLIEYSFFISNSIWLKLETILFKFVFLFEI